VDLKGPLSENYFCSSNEYFQKDLRTINLFETSIFFPNQNFVKQSQTNRKE
jgi:hypothetical protein